MVENRLRDDMPNSMSERIASGAGAKPNETVQQGSGARRTITNIHHAGHHVDPKTMTKKGTGE